MKAVVKTTEPEEFSTCDNPEQRGLHCTLQVVPRVFGACARHNWPTDLRTCAVTLPCLSPAPLEL